MEFRTVTLFKKLIKKQVIEKFVSLEKDIMKAIKALTIAHSMERRVYFFDFMRINKLMRFAQN